MRLRRQNDFRTFAEKSAVALHSFDALQKTSHCRRQRGFWPSLACRNRAFLFVYFVCFVGKSAGNEPLKNGNGATARRSSIC